MVVKDQVLEEMIKTAEKEVEANDVAPLSEEEELLLTYTVSTNTAKALVGKLSSNALRRVIRGYISAGLEEHPKLLSKTESSLFRALNAVRNTMFRLTNIAESKKLESEETE